MIKINVKVASLPPLFTALAMNHDPELSIKWFDGTKLSNKKTYHTITGTIKKINKRLLSLEQNLANIFNTLPVQHYDVSNFCNLLSTTEEFLLIGNKETLEKFSFFAMLSNVYISDYTIIREMPDNEFFFIKHDTLGILNIKSDDDERKGVITLKCAIGIYDVVNRVQLSGLP